jgi:hypothetical protein
MKNIRIVNLDFMIIFALELKLFKIKGLFAKTAPLNGALLCITNQL